MLWIKQPPTLLAIDSLILTELYFQGVRVLHIHLSQHKHSATDFFNLIRNFELTCCSTLKVVIISVVLYDIVHFKHVNAK